MPKNVLTQVTKWSELDACLLRGYTHTAVWLQRNGYNSGPLLPQKDLCVIINQYNYYYYYKYYHY